MIHTDKKLHKNPYEDQMNSTQRDFMSTEDLTVKYTSDNPYLKRENSLSALENKNSDLKTPAGLLRKA